MRTVIEKKTRVELVENPLPFDYSEVLPFTASEYEDRIRSLVRKGIEKGYTHLIVYGDREHFNNIYYLSGLDPRFEESLLILAEGAKPIIVVGNEMMGFSGMLSLDVERVLYQNFSLMGQPRDNSETLKKIFEKSGIGPESRIGIIGWKQYAQEGFETKFSILDIPNYMVETLSAITKRENLLNAVDLLSDPEYGLKHHISVNEAIHFEAMGTKISRKIYHFLKNLKPGMTEIEASGLMCLDAEPWSMYPIVTFGDEHNSYTLGSPSYTRQLAIGDVLGVGFGYRGSLVHRHGFYARNIEDIPSERRGRFDEFIKPFYAALAGWYESLKIGAEFGDAYEAVDSSIGMEAFGITLNPGHPIHYDEWTDSPFQKGSRVKMHSGVAIQSDFDAQVKNPFAAVHAEDGLLLADEKMREELKRKAPKCWRRIEARQKFFREVLNIRINDEVLPLSDMGGVYFPYMADTSVIFCMSDR
jgi:hypothetical protein